MDVFAGDWLPDRLQSGHEPHESAMRLDTNAFIDSRPNTLLAAEVSLGRLNRDVPQGGIGSAPVHRLRRSTTGHTSAAGHEAPFSQFRLFGRAHEPRSTPPSPSSLRGGVGSRICQTPSTCCHAWADP